MMEAGVAKFEYSTWYGMLAPAHTGAQVVKKLNAATTAVLSKPQVRERLTMQGLDVLATTQDSFQRYLKDEIRRWEQIVKAAGLAKP